MRKETATTLIIAALVVLTGGLALVYYIGTDAETGGGSLNQDSRRLVIEQWGVSFTLPASIDPSVIETSYSIPVDESDPEQVRILSQELVGAQTDMCSGKVVRLGGFASISMQHEPFGEQYEGAHQVGENYYWVAEGLQNETCYSADLYNKYFGESVASHISNSLRVVQ